jgi:hypothetical protein
MARILQKLKRKMLNETCQLQLNEEINENILNVSSFHLSFERKIKTILSCHSNLFSATTNDLGELDITNQTII